MVVLSPIMRYKSNKPFVVSVVALLLLVATFAFSTVRTAYAASDEVSKSGEHLLVVHDGSTEQGFLTHASTVGEALKGANIPFDESDLIEPSLDEELVAKSYDINIYRARPITVVDGALRMKIMSAYRTPAQIVAHAGLELRREDKTEMQLAGDTTRSGAGTELLITRATPFTLTLYGKQTVAYTQAKTVGDMLDEKGVSLSGSDTLSVAKDTPIVAGMVVELWREGKQTVTVEEEIDFEIEQIQDVDREVGFKEVVTAGIKGKRTVTYEIEMKNGTEVNRKEIQSVTMAEPVEQVERIGAKPQHRPYSGGGNKDTWLAASNIPRDQWGNAEWLVQKESGWNPDAVNRYSGACGLGQQLPCGKWPGAWNDPVASLNGMHGYVMGRYGSWDAAVAHSRARGWY